MHSEGKGNPTRLGLAACGVCHRILPCRIVCGVAEGPQRGLRESPVLCHASPDRCHSKIKRFLPKRKKKRALGISPCWVLAAPFYLPAPKVWPLPKPWPGGIVGFPFHLLLAKPHFCQILCILFFCFSILYGWDLHLAVSSGLPHSGEVKLGSGNWDGIPSSGGRRVPWTPQEGAGRGGAGWACPARSRSGKDEAHAGKEGRAGGRKADPEVSIM